MRVLVCGGRAFADAMFLWETLDSLQDVSEIIAGGADGADTLAETWARERGISCQVYRADWQAHGRAAGPIRNQQMLDFGKPDLVLAFAGGRGTADMVRKARAAGVPVRLAGFE